MQALRVDIEGLDLVLGGGVPLLKRHETFAGQSATLVLRGPPGSGKTVFGTRLAVSVARTLEVDVAYGCVELLPSELAAQHAGLMQPNAKERVVVPPFSREKKMRGACHVYAGVLDLGTPGEEPSRLVPAIGELLGAMHEAGSNPGVLVIDPLSDGYGLGRSASRLLADELCKMAAQQGMILVLLEETTGSDQSNWCFAADLVIELDIGSLLGEGEEVLHRRARFTKNRFGGCEPGPHRLEMNPASGVRVYPNPVTYMRPWAVNTLLPKWTAYAWQWGMLAGVDTPANRIALDKYTFNRDAVLVHGTGAREVVHVATSIGVPGPPARRPVPPTLTIDGPTDGSKSASIGPPPVDVLLSFGIEPGIFDSDSTRYGALEVVALGTMFTTDRAIAAAMRTIARTESIGRVFVGDLRRIYEAWSQERTRQTLGPLMHCMKRAGIPVILLETGDPFNSNFAQFADITVSVGLPASPPRVTLVHLGVDYLMMGDAKPTSVGDSLMLRM